MADRSGETWVYESIVGAVPGVELSDRGYSDGDDATMTAAGEDAPQYGETWVYESIVGALPGASLSGRAAIALQIAIFQASLFVLAWLYDLWAVVPAGTAAIGVAAAGSALMLRFSAATRKLDLPPTYQRFLFSSGIEVVLGVLAFVALVTHLFVFDPANAATPLVERLLGPDPPLVGVYVLLLILWDVCYRIGTGWWASVSALWRSARLDLDPDTRRTFVRADLETMGFGLLQLIFVPFVAGQPVLLAAVLGHVLAVTAVTGLSLAILYARAEN